MIEINTWMNTFLSALDENFGDKIWFVGLQGSYGRNEATDTSDIDVVVIFDELKSKDIDNYNQMLNGLTNRELICGFVSGKDELLNWEPSDLFQFYNDTKPIRGSLDELLPLIDHKAIQRSIKIGVCNIYHGCVHNMLFDKNDEILKGLYKSASFVVQAIHFKQTGKYVSYLTDLKQVVFDKEKEIIQTFMKLKKGGNVNFDEMSQLLFSWSREWIKKA